MISLFLHSLWIYNISRRYSGRLVSVNFHIVLVTYFRIYEKRMREKKELSCFLFMRTKTARYLEDVLHKYPSFPVSSKGTEWKQKNEIKSEDKKISFTCRRYDITWCGFQWTTFASMLLFHSAFHFEIQPKIILSTVLMNV